MTQNSHKKWAEKSNLALHCLTSVDERLRDENVILLVFQDFNLTTIIFSQLLGFLDLI